ERYKFNHTFHGDLPGRFAATGWRLFRRVWLIWLLGMLPVIALATGVFISVAGARMARHHDLIGSQTALSLAGFLIIGGCVSCVALPFLHALRKATEWRWWAEGIRFGEVEV